MRRATVAVGVGLVCFLSGAARAGVVTLDQFYGPVRETGGSIVDTASPSFEWAQTFTAGLAGDLDHVDLYLSRGLNGSPFDFVVEVRTTTSGVPDTGGPAVLGTVSVSSAAVPISWGFFSVDLSTLSIPVAPGLRLAIAIRDLAGGDSGTSSIISWAGGPNGYAGGQMFGRNPVLDPAPWGEFPFDLSFRTYVDVSSVAAVPLPPSALLGFGVLTGLGLVRRSRRLSAR